MDRTHLFGEDPGQELVHARDGERGCAEGANHVGHVEREVWVVAVHEFGGPAHHSTRHPAAEGLSVYHLA